MTLTDLAAALGLVLVLEGLALSLFPGAVRRAMLMAQGLPDGTLRWAGAGALAAGVLVVWLARG